MDETAGTEPLSNEELDRLIEELDSASDRLPERALRSAREHREQVVPRLIRAMEDATTVARAGAEDIGNAPFFALFLLAEFEAKEGLSAILDAISLPGELPFDLFGDAITEALPRVLAVLAGDRTDVLEELIRNRDLNEYVRWEAAGAYKFLVRDDRISRDEVVARLRQHLREAIGSRDEQIAHALVSELITFCPHEAREEIEEAFRQDLIATWSVSIEDVRESFAEGEEGIERELSNLRPTSIETIEELSRWYAFSDSPSSSSRGRDYWAPEPIDVDERAYVPPNTIVSESPRVRRNEPCPCGSGRKYKKCCGAAR